jgi:hypothetical protein
MHAQKALVTDVIMPFLNMLEQKLGEWINAKFKTNYVLDFDVTSYPELAPDVEKIINTYGKSMAFTPNELRTLIGFDESEYEGMDDHWITSSMVTVKEASVNPDFTDFQQ